MTEQIPAETQARWQAAMLGVEWHVCDLPGQEGELHIGNDLGNVFTSALNIYESDTALIDAVELAEIDMVKIPNPDPVWEAVTGIAGQRTHRHPGWRAAATAAVEAAIREWEREQ